MPKFIITDTTSPLILLDKIGYLNLLHKVYGELKITLEVKNEYGKPLPDWITVLPVTDKKYQILLETRVDKGEASVLALAAEVEDVLLLLDDLKARKLAKQLGFKITGTLGVIHKAKQLNAIEKVKPLLDKLENTNFWIADHIMREILRLNNEL